MMDIRVGSLTSSDRSARGERPDLTGESLRQIVLSQGWQVAQQTILPDEYALLRHLAQNANRVLSHVDLLMAVWGPEYRDEVDYLRAYVRYLRRKIEADPSNPRSIVTLPGVGYMLSCPDDE